MNRKLLTPYGLKFNPFSAQIPVEALWNSPVITQFCWRLEQQLGEGGFALISGVSGSGKSATLRLLKSRLANQREVTVGVLSRPQAALADFYRELGDLFGVPLRPHNRWASAKALRERWLQHINTALARPVLLVDEAPRFWPNCVCSRAPSSIPGPSSPWCSPVTTVSVAGWRPRNCYLWPAASGPDCAPSRCQPLISSNACSICSKPPVTPG
jgi:AAA domain-containing protein